MRTIFGDGFQSKSRILHLSTPVRFGPFPIEIQLIKHGGFPQTQNRFQTITFLHNFDDLYDMLLIFDEKNREISQ